ncbi:26S proteasome regulatory subunit 4 homolog [Hibiscus syriacus]|uniref:26S proteasome regulatory subunit 4 homolog n=1 Tax=Hibiscus syriacus TaxID=106335 RepID=UPI00192362F3|nr:26S proteasome regulatory subunit 4 homolog [Hibiscus syriacus]
MEDSLPIGERLKALQDNQFSGLPSGVKLGPGRTKRGKSVKKLYLDGYTLGICLINLQYRYDAHSGGEREIQRTMLELLNQLYGFDSRGDVKVILATNRIESLDPALLRPGRIDRKIEFPLPDIRTRSRIFQIHTSKMTLANDVNLEEFVID